jgi:DNA-binding CsgD family transcriptional regulator
MKKRGDLIGVIEAAYDTESSEAAWLEHLISKMAPLFNEGAPLAGYFFRLRNGARDIEVSTNAATDPGTYNETNLAATHRTMRRVTPDLRKAYVDCPPLDTLAHAVGRENAAAIAASGMLGCVNLVGLRSNSESDAGLLLCSPVAADYRLPHPKRVLWTRVAAHVGAALRLRKRVGPREAIFTSSGKLAHAEGEAVHARGELTDAARRVDRARGRVRRADPEAATELWRALVRGDWSLVDWFDHDGKRFLVAHRNTHLSAAPAKDARLSAREWQVVGCAAMGHSNKLIAYDLGLSETSVASYLRRAAKKLGATSRVGLVRAYREAYGS